MNDETINENTNNEDLVVHQTVYSKPPLEPQMVDVEFKLGDDETTEETKIADIFNIDINDPTSKKTEKELADWISIAKTMVTATESQWNQTKKEFSLTTENMIELHKFNSDHRVERTTESEDEYDRFNGINHMTYDDSVKIFGEGHPIMGGVHTITIDRIKLAMDDLYSWTKMLNDYNKVHNLYEKFLEESEEYNIELLRQKALEETDEVKKAAALDSERQYYRKKYLDFFADKLDDKSIDRLVRSFYDVDKVKYLVEKAATKLDKMGISKMFIMQISGFEKRFLPEKYHGQNNLFLLYFLDMCAFTKLNVDNNDKIFKIKCITLAMNKFIRNSMNESQRERTLDNIIALEDQFIDLIKPSSNDINSGSVDNII
jgi:hypothetical protein